MKQSGRVYVPSGVSSFFEICDRTPEGAPIEDLLHVGARGGGFLISRGTNTVAYSSDEIKSDVVLINGTEAPEALTSLTVLNLLRNEFEIPFVKLSHSVASPIGQGFGTSGAGALATSIATIDLFDLKLTLSRAAEFAHIAEIKNLTGLGTVISLASGAGAIGLVTEPGSYSVGKTDSILTDYEGYILVCAAFGQIKKSKILSDPLARGRINEFGKNTLMKILDEPTPERLLAESRLFSEKTGLASDELLKLSDRAVKAGAVGATPNMIGNAIHCLVEKNRYREFMQEFSVIVPKEALFESQLIQSGPRITRLESP
jgi:pantoate kinase